MKVSYELSFVSHLNLFDMMKPSHQRIAVAFAWFYKLQKRGDHKISYPTQRTLAKLAQCSSCEVSRFLKIYKPFCFGKVIQQKKTISKGHNLYGSNLYQYSESFFDMVCFLKEKGWWGNWKKMRLFIVSQFNEDEEVTKQKLGYNEWLINSKNANGLRSKTQTKDLRDSSNPAKGKKVPTNPDPVPHFGPPLKKTASETLKVPGLSNSFLMRFDRFGSLFIAQEVNKDYDFAMKYGKAPRCADRWVESRLQNQMKYQYQVLKGQKNV